MANRKEYAYFIKGNKLALIQRDFNLSHGLNYVYDPSKGLEIGSGNAAWKSPLETVTRGLEIEYAYSPHYIINDVSETAAINLLAEVDGKIQLTLGSTQSYTATNKILIRNSGQFDGIHEIAEDTSTSANVKLTTAYNGEALTVTGLGWVVHNDIKYLNFEADEIPVSEYLSKAVVDYVKAQLLGDRGDFKGREYYLKQFYKKIEKHDSSRVYGERALMSGRNAIR